MLKFLGVVFKFLGAMLLSFALGYSGVATASAIHIITEPLKPVVVQPSPIDAGSVCAIAQSVAKISHCIVVRDLRTVTFNLETSGAEALKVCQSVAAQIGGMGAGDLRIKVFSAYQFEAIASCYRT